MEGRGGETMEPVCDETIPNERGTPWGIGCSGMVAENGVIIGALFVAVVDKLFRYREDLVRCCHWLRSGSVGLGCVVLVGRLGGR